jgi:hypothetical protein
MTVQVLASARAGIESARGTSVTPTRIIYPKNGGIVHTQDVGTIIPQEAWASFEPNRRAYAGLERDTFSMAGDLSFTDAIWLANHAIAPLASGSVTDTTAYTWAFSPNNTSRRPEVVDVAVRLEGPAQPSSAGRCQASICNRTRSDVHEGRRRRRDRRHVRRGLHDCVGATQITAFTGSLTDRTIVNALGNSRQVYVNGTGSAFGTTADTRINQATFEVTNGYVYRDGFDGTSNAIELVRTAFRMSKLTVQRYFNDKTELTRTSPRRRGASASVPMAG